MLTRSPIPASTSANVSPRSGFPNFHYATAPSPRHSPARVPPAASSRGPSMSSPPSGSVTPRSPSFPRPKRWVGVDAATQYSPMERVDYRTGLVRAPPPAPDEVILEPPPPPAPRPMVLPDDNSAAQSSASTVAQSTISRIQPKSISSTAQPPKPISTSSRAAKKMEPSDPDQAISPTKRRNSQGPGNSNLAVAQVGVVVGESSSLPKRPKPETAPPKIVPRRYELCPVEDVVILIAHMLGELIETNDELALRSGNLTRFHSRTAPGISVLDYLHRLAKHATLTPPLLLSMVYYIDRLCAMYPEFTINTLTVHRFLITAATVAAKGLSDAFWNNSTYARVGGVRVAELKLLELEFLYRVDWRIVPNPEVLEAYYKGLVDRCPGYQLESLEKTAALRPEEEDEEDSSDIVDDEDTEDDGADGGTAANVPVGGNLDDATSRSSSASNG